MNNQKPYKNRINTVLIIVLLTNIIGDLGNVVLWRAIPASRALSLNTGFIGNAVGADNALVAGSVILIIVSVVYIAAFIGLFKKQHWGPLLVIANSIANRGFAVILYKINLYFTLWGVWTIVLVVVALLDYHNLTNSDNQSRH